MAHTFDGVPVIDMSLSDADEAYVEAKRKMGFVSVIHHGVDEALITEAHGVIERVFALDEELLVRKYHNRNREETYGRTGYFPFGSEKAKEHEGGWDLKRFWMLYRAGHPIPNVYPDEAPEFAEVMHRLFDSLDRLAHRLLSALTSHSGTDPLMPYEECAKGGDTVMRPLFYPAYENAPEDSLRSTPHEDINLITLLVAATKPGLQILDKHGNWVPVENPPESIVVNTGDMLQMTTFGDFPSMTHRVVNDGISDSSRISIPFFVHPRPEVPLMTLGRWRERCDVKGVESISPKVMRQLVDLGLKRKMHMPDDTPLCTAGEYLTLRLKEIGVI